jgi:hypothetical protein
VEEHGRGFDGIRFDTRNTIWAATVDGVSNYTTDGTLLGKIHLPGAGEQSDVRWSQAKSALRDGDPLALFDSPQHQRRGVTG